MQTFRVVVGELHRYRAPHGLADQVDFFEFQQVEQPQQVRAEVAQRPVVPLGRDGGPAKATGVQPHHPVLTGQQRHPGIPQPGVFGIAMVEHHRLGFAPRVGEVIVLVVHLQRVVDLGKWHFSPPLSAVTGRASRPGEWPRRPGPYHHKPPWCGHVRSSRRPTEHRRRRRPVWCRRPGQPLPGLPA